MTVEVRHSLQNTLYLLEALVIHSTYDIQIEVMPPKRRRISKPFVEVSEEPGCSKVKVEAPTDVPSDLIVEELHTKSIDDLDVEHVEIEFVEEQNATVDNGAFTILGKPKRKKVNPEAIDYNAARYYSRYKNQEYVKRNDKWKYCQICKKKVYSNLRSLPSEHRLRRIWILRLNLDAERSAELWVREAFTDAAHCGEACKLHFPVGSDHLKNRELLPTDMRHDPESYSIYDDETFDFDSLELDCVFCSAKSPLRSMVPFTRTRSRRYKWIKPLGDSLSETDKISFVDKLKDGSSRFLCDYHFSDGDFDINQFGEWRLRKDAIPDPNLAEQDKQGPRVYMINHGDTVLSRHMDSRMSRTEFLKKEYRVENYRFLPERMKRHYPQYYDNTDYDGEEFIYDDDMGDDVYGEPLNDDYNHNQTDRSLLPGEHFPKEERDDFVLVEYSDDSDDEVDLLSRINELGPQVSGTRFCQVCSRVVASDKSMQEYRPRTWPFDEPKHRKWLEIMNWPRDFEESMKVLWMKRKNDLAYNESYHYCPINICESHLLYRNLHVKMEEWLQSYCVICDEDLGDANLLLPFPNSALARRNWIKTLTSLPSMNKSAEKKWTWLRERLIRSRATRYRICVYHFCSDAFVEKDDCIEFNEVSTPLPLGLSEYDITPRGPQALVKCPLCDTWSPDDDLIEIRHPSNQAERILLVEVLTGDKTLLKKGVEQLAIHPCKICRSHLPDTDPYSIIAERRLVANVELQCVQCNDRQMGANMVPFPIEDDEKRRLWIDAMCRDHFLKTRLIERLEIEGRHYLCPSHFHKNSIRYIPGLGIWKRFIYLPLAATNLERDRLYHSRELDSSYQPLLISGLDDAGVVVEVQYEEVSVLLGETDSDYHRSDTNGRVVGLKA